MSASTAPETFEHLTDGELVEAALTKSKLSGKRFAEDVIGCDESTLRRWRNQRTAMSEIRRRWFINYLAE